MKHRIANMKLESKHETGAKKKNFGVFGKLLHKTLNKKHETYHLKYSTANIKYEYLCNTEHTKSNMKYRTGNMKLERKHETRAKKKNFGVFEKLLYETLNNKHETDH